MALLAFQNHAECPLGFLLEHTQRRRVAEAVNQAILRTQKQVLGIQPKFKLSVHLNVTLVYLQNQCYQQW